MADSQKTTRIDALTDAEAVREGAEALTFALYHELGIVVTGFENAQGLVSALRLLLLDADRRQKQQR